MAMVYLLIENGRVKYVTQNHIDAELWVSGRKRVAIEREVKSVPIYNAAKHRDSK